MIRLFQILAVILAGIAAYFLWADDIDSVFVAGVLSIVSYLLSMRFQIKERLRQRADRESNVENGKSES
jgi:hypothetical protein